MSTEATVRVVRVSRRLLVGLFVVPAVALGVAACQPDTEAVINKTDGWVVLWGGMGTPSVHEGQLPAGQQGRGLLSAEFGGVRVIHVLGGRAVAGPAHADAGRQCLGPGRGLQ